MYLKLRFHITGDAPLIMNNGHAQDRKLAINQQRTKIQSNRHKTEQDLDELERLDFLVALYLDLDENKNEVPVIPGENIEGCLFGKSGAASATKGITRKNAAAAIFVEGSFPLQYDGPKNKDELQKLDEFQFRTKAVRSGISNYIIRPIFHDWAADIEILYNDELIDAAVVAELLEYAGQNVGLCDWRPKYGRFSVEQIDVE